MTSGPSLDQDAMDAALDLIGRTGAKQMEVGYLHEDVPPEQADWYAHAQYQGARVIAEHHHGPVEALEALARRLLHGGLCTHCHKTITLSGKSKKYCRWTRRGDKWVRGCEKTHD
jgi:hypothetical protein